MMSLDKTVSLVGIITNTISGVLNAALGQTAWVIINAIALGVCIWTYYLAHTAELAEHGK